MNSVLMLIKKGISCGHPPWPTRTQWRGFLKQLGTTILKTQGTGYSWLHPRWGRHTLTHAHTHVHKEGRDSNWLGMMKLHEISLFWKQRSQLPLQNQWVHLSAMGTESWFISVSTARMHRFPAASWRAESLLPKAEVEKHIYRHQPQPRRASNSAWNSTAWPVDGTDTEPVAQDV